MLGIGLMLFCLRTSFRTTNWADSLLKATFWSLNIGLFAMVFMSLVPAGVYQAYHAITTGFWYARSAEIIHSPIMETLVWMRVPGDIVFSVGAIALGLFIARLLFFKGQPDATVRELPESLRPKAAPEPELVPAE